MSLVNPSHHHFAVLLTAVGRQLSNPYICHMLMHIQVDGHWFDCAGSGLPRLLGFHMLASTFATKKKE